MCGISLIVDFRSGATIPLLEAVARVHAAQAHRGPDGEGWLLVDDRLEGQAFYRPVTRGEVPDALRLAATFRRLIIQDASDAARQPLGARDARQWVLHNGEIYNCAELRSELRQRGHTFQGCSDTEVVLAAYRAWGPDCFARFAGMWAILIVDLEQGLLVGSRDRLGIKPLYYTIAGGRLALASEPGALAIADGARPGPDPSRFHEFLGGLPPQAQGPSFFEGIQAVPAATFFEFDLRTRAAKEPTFHRYWSLPDRRDLTPAPSFDAACSEYSELFQAALQSHLTGVVPLGCLLSGGLDSSMVLCSAARELSRSSAERVHSYSITYTDPGMSEWPFILAAARAANSKNHALTLTPSAVWQSIDRVVRTQGQPLLGQDVIAQDHAYRIAAEGGSVVVLDGNGPDELLAGLPVYADPRRRPAQRYSWLEPMSVPGDAPAPALQSADPSALNRNLFTLVTTTNLPTVLSYQDRSSMAHGIESRVPFLDHRLVEYCFSLPPEHKLQDGIRKRLLWQVAHGTVPELILNRRDKKWFVSSVDWMPLRSTHGPELREMARARRLREAPFVNDRSVEGFVDHYVAGRHDDHSAVWRLYTAWRWLETYNLS